MTVIKIPADVWNFIRDRAVARDGIKLEGTSKRFDDKKKDLELHTYGMGAEYAFSIATGLNYNFDAKIKGDDGYDFKTPSGLTIEIRYRFQRKRDFSLNGNTMRHFPADIGVLVWPGQEKLSFEIVGWVSRVSFAFYCEEKNLKGPRLLVPWQKMRKFEELLWLFKKEKKKE